jgi:hypothetical protein
MHLNFNTHTLLRLQTVRPVVRPNQGFMFQLQLYESLLNFNQMDSVVMNWYQLQNVAKKVSKSNYWNYYFMVK